MNLKSANQPVNGRSGQPSPSAHSYARLILCVAGVLLVGSLLAGAQTAPGSYQVANILSDGFVPAATTDPNFIDPWGVSMDHDFWINANVSGLDYVAFTNASIGFKVRIPGPGGTGTGSPTGSVFNPEPGFLLSNGLKASFLFCSLDGTISGWNGAYGTYNRALLAVDNSARNALYTDMAFLKTASANYILVANFGQGASLEVYDSAFKPATLAGSFTDPNVPAGYAPYAVHTLGSQVFVTYMLRTVPPFAAGALPYQEILGSNTGFVSVFDTSGTFVARAVTGGNLNAPWGVAIAPANWGIYGGALLIGNFGDGLINAYDAKTYTYLGQVTDSSGKAIAYPGLWEILFGTPAYGDVNGMYFTAGLANETHGLFGVITNGPTTTATPTFGLSLSSPVASTTVGGTSSVTLSIAPVNAFTGTVTLACSGAPQGAQCSFSTSSLAVSPGAPATTTVTLRTSSGGSRGTYRAGAHPQLRRMAAGIAAAVMFPLGLLMLGAPRNRRRGLRLPGAVLVLAASTGLIAGCYSSPAPAPATPAGTSNITITATSGAVTQSTVLALTVQ